MNKPEMFKNCQTDEIKNLQWLEDRVVNIPSIVREENLKIVLIRKMRM